MRRTSVLLLAFTAASGGFLFTSGPAHAQSRPSLALPTSEPVATASDAASRVVRVQMPSLTKVTVRPGDTLWGIGIRTHRSWPALASYNRIPNPDLITVGQVVMIPAATYQAPRYVPTPARRPPPVVSYQPKRTYSTPTRVSMGGSSAGSGSGVWACIGQHESGGNPATNTGNGYYGAFQDTVQAWQAGGGGPGLPSSYSYSEQLRVNENLQARVGWGAWPNTSRMCGV